MGWKAIALAVAMFLLTGCHPKVKVWVYTSDNCPAKADLYKNVTKCHVNPDGRKWCDNVEIKESCAPAKDENK